MGFVRETHDWHQQEGEERRSNPQPQTHEGIRNEISGKEFRLTSDLARGSGLGQRLDVLEQSGGISKAFQPAHSQPVCHAQEQVA